MLCLAGGCEIGIAVLALKSPVEHESPRHVASVELKVGLLSHFIFSPLEEAEPCIRAEVTGQMP